MIVIQVLGHLFNFESLSLQCTPMTHFMLMNLDLPIFGNRMQIKCISLCPTPSLVSSKCMIYIDFELAIISSCPLLKRCWKWNWGCTHRAFCLPIRLSRLAKTLQQQSISQQVLSTILNVSSEHQFRWWIRFKNLVQENNWFYWKIKI